jgi:hypothetical protein
MRLVYSVALSPNAAMLISFDRLPEQLHCVAVLTERQQ